MVYEKIEISSHNNNNIVIILLKWTKTLALFMKLWYNKRQLGGKRNEKNNENNYDSLNFSNGNHTSC